MYPHLQHLGTSNVNLSTQFRQHFCTFVLWLSLSGCSDSNIGIEICNFLKGITSNYGCTLLGGNSWCALTCGACNATSRADQEHLGERGAGLNVVEGFGALKGLEDIYYDKDKLAQLVEILGRDKVNS